QRQLQRHASAGRALAKNERAGVTLDGAPRDVQAEAGMPRLGRMKWLERGRALGVADAGTAIFDLYHVARFAGPGPDVDIAVHPRRFDRVLDQATNGERELVRVR